MSWLTPQANRLRGSLVRTPERREVRKQARGALAKEFLEYVTASLSRRILVKDLHEPVSTTLPHGSEWSFFGD
jgi:hypothetical protein